MSNEAGVADGSTFGASSDTTSRDVPVATMDSTLDVVATDALVILADAGDETVPFDVTTPPDIRSADVGGMDTGATPSDATPGPDGAADSRTPTGDRPYLTFQITSPVVDRSGPSPTAVLSRNLVIISGVCDPSVEPGSIEGMLGTSTEEKILILSDNDCSDGVWSAIPTLIDPDPSGVNVSFGTPDESDSVTFLSPAGITEPTFASQYSTRRASVDVGFTCPTGWQYSVMGGVLTPCLPTQVRNVALTEGVPFVFEVTFLGSSGENYSDAIELTRDNVVPAPPTGSVVAQSHSNHNFVGVRVTPSEDGHCFVARDALCHEIIGVDLCYAGIETTIPSYIEDNSSNAVFVQSIDMASNDSSCVPVGFATEVTPAVIPCDVMFGAGNRTGTEINDIVAVVATLGATYVDGEFVVCMYGGVRVTGVPVIVSTPETTLRGLGPGRPLLNSVLVLAAGAALEDVDIAGAMNINTDASVRHIRNTAFGTNIDMYNARVGVFEDSTASWISVNGYVGRFTRATLPLGIRVGIYSSGTVSGFNVIRSVTDSTGVYLALHDRTLLRQFQNNRIETTTAPFLNEQNILGNHLRGEYEHRFYPRLGIGYVMQDNTFCALSGATLRTFAANGMTLPEMPTPGTRSGTIYDFPWGDASDVANAPNNVQTSWRDPCP